ncbi:unnamed protein product, partial [Owenia fusiformis]
VSGSEMEENDKFLELDIFVSENAIEEGAIELMKSVRPEWKAGDIKFKVFTEGITNKLIGCYKGSKEDMVLVRVYGNKTDLIIDREAELRNMLVLHSEGCAPPPYAKFNNGLCYAFVHGICLDEKTVREEKIGRLVAEEMAKIHDIQESSRSAKQSKIEREPMLFKKIKTFLNLVPEEFQNPEKNERYKKGVKNRKDLERELEELKEHLETINSPVVLCHNDLLLQNIVYNEEIEKITFIDYEYGFYNYQAYDIANHFNEFAGVETVDYTLYPDKELQYRWLRDYLSAWYSLQGLNKIPTERDIEILYVEVNKYSLASHFFWGVWALIQARFSDIDFDFLGYAMQRLNEFHSQKEERFALTMPE